MIGIPLTMKTPPLASSLTMVAETDEYVMKCNFMLEQLTSLDQKLHRLTSDLNHVYLTEKQAEDLKLRWKRQQIATQRLKQSIAKELQEQQKSLYQQIDQLSRQVRQLRKQQRETSSVNAQKLRQLEELQEEYHHENKVNISYQKQFNRSIQQNQIVEMKMQQQVIQQQNVEREQEELTKRNEQKVQQSSLIKKYEVLKKRKDQLMLKKEDDENNFKEKLKKELNKLMKVEEQIIEEEVCFREMEHSLAEQRIVIQQLKAEEGIEEERPVKVQRQIELMKIKSKNHYIGKYFEGSDAKQFQINIPNYVTPISKQSRKKSIPTFGRIPQRRYTKISQQRRQQHLPLIRIPNEKNAESTGKNIHLKRGTESSIEIKDKTTMENGKASIKKSIEVKQPQKKTKKEEDRSSISSDDNIFRPVKIIKQISIEPKKEYIKQEESEEEKPERVFVKPIFQRKVQLQKLAKNALEYEPPKKIKTEEVQYTSLEPQYRSRKATINAYRPEINLVAEKRIHFDTDSLESEVEQIKPLVISKPPERIQSKLSHKLESTATDVHNSFALSKKIVKNRGKRNHGRGVSYETEGYPKEASDSGSFRISANSFMFDHRSIKYSELGHIPQYTAEELGLSQQS